ncbi:MAG TPA: crossover junction endodeoxyribonuclease RuvC [Candidatus Paceibacterota bacterium]|nr:crossover junction endodeoxyribonuclease RuvC [Candidatus Paceibacterota bacterium]
MIVIGIDPGTARVGYGVIKKECGKISFLDAGILKIIPSKKQYVLLQIKKELDSLFKKWRPEIVGVERVYFSKNQKTAMSVAEARGVIVLAVLEAGIEIKECSPNEVKSGLTGYGHADKRGIAKMVNLALGTPSLKIIDDASDALAIAIFAAGTLRDGKRPS